MGMIKPFTYDREDTCPQCKSERSIEAYDYNGNPLKLSLSIDRGVPIKQKNISYLKCKNCKAEFFPNWVTEYPTPMTDVKRIRDWLTPVSVFIFINLKTT